MPTTTRNKHTVVAYMEDHPGVLNRVASLFRRRGFNIESLTVGHTEVPDVSRMTIVVDGRTTAVEQVMKQLYKVVEVLKVTDVSEEKIVSRDLALIKVSATSSTRGEIMQIADIYHGNVVDVSGDSLIIEVTGPDEKIDSLLDLLRKYGIKEMVRTGRVVMVRGASPTSGRVA
jgi:acetolactate synthase-1/3 small subunit